MAIYTMVCGQMTNKMVRENLHGQMEMYILENLKIYKDMDREF